MQPGDKVRCVEAAMSMNLLTHGAVYTIKTVFPTGLQLEEVDNPSGFWTKDRFEPLPRYVVTLGPTLLTLEEAQELARKLAVGTPGLVVSVSKLQSTIKAEVTIHETR